MVYVNGTEAARSNLAAGAVSFTQKALVDVTGAGETTPVALTLPTNLFHTGTNTIAVEVHNKANAPGDLGFDAELKFNTGGGGGGGGGAGVVVDYGSTWKYLDTGVDQGTAWRAAAFNDTAWASGPGSLGFGNTPLGTTLNRAQKRTTYYFRRTFNVTGAVSTATLDLLRDDGAVVYIDGTEVARTNMPAGTVGFATQAPTEITGAAEKNAVTLTLPTGRADGRHPHHRHRGPPVRQRRRGPQHGRTAHPRLSRPPEVAGRTGTDLRAGPCVASQGPDPPEDC